jgi:hypothetical protein
MNLNDGIKGRLGVARWNQHAEYQVVKVKSTQLFQQDISGNLIELNLMFGK